MLQVICSINLKELMTTETIPSFLLPKSLAPFIVPNTTDFAAIVTKALAQLVTEAVTPLAERIYQLEAEAAKYQEQLLQFATAANAYTEEYTDKATDRAIEEAIDKLEIEVSAQITTRY